MGAFELLLFVLLYNLRISARAQSSEVLFTIGNHELMSIIQPSMGAFDMYAADTTRSFFGEGMIDVEDAMAYRSGVLLPFLHMSPYYFIRMEHGGTQEIVCVHGGLHREDGDGSHLEELERLQQRINATDGTLAMMQETVLGGDEGPLWLRTYSEAKDGLCHRLTPAPLLTIVGHCITGTGFPRFQTLLENPIYYGCDETSEIGCVLMDCNDASGAPRLLFVDTGSGKSQRTPSHGSYQEIPNKTRLAQMIKCTHDSDLVGARYFNQIERVAKVNPAGYSVSGLDMGGTLLYRALSKESALPPPPANAAVMAPPRPSSLSSAAFMTPPPPSLSSASVELPSSGSARPRLPAGWGLPPPPPPPSSAAAIAANAALLKPSSMSSSSSSPSRPRLPAAWALPAPALLPEVPANATVTAPPPTRPASARARLPAGWGAPTGGRRTRAHRRTRRRAAKRTRRHRK